MSNPKFKTINIKYDVWKRIRKIAFDKDMTIVGVVEMLLNEYEKNKKEIR